MHYFQYKAYKNNTIGIKMAVSESTHNNGQKRDEDMLNLPEFFQREFPNLARFLYESLLKDFA
jgi:hypothetical protein